MKQLKFDHMLAEAIVAGKKTSTFRVADDKDIKVGDELRIVDKVQPDNPASWLVVGVAKVTESYTKIIKDLDDSDYTPDERYENPENMVMVYRQYYGNQLSAEQPVKVIRFQFAPYAKPQSYFVAIGNISHQNTESAIIPWVVSLFADGGSRGNPGPSALGYVVYDEQKRVLQEGSKYLGITTNNQAEYHALKAGLEWCKAHNVREVNVFLDSLLVINQMKGLFKVKNRDLWPLYEAIKKLAAEFDHVRFTHVPRELNKAADAEVNKALDAINP